MVTIMLVDDEELIRVSLRYAIGCVMNNARIVAEASNGEEALELALKVHPDIIITDVKMPVMDGIELIRAVREQRLDCQVVVLSGYADFEYARQAIRYHVSEYLLKPISQDKLREALERCVEQKPREFEQEKTVAQEIVSYIQQHFAEELSLEMLAREFSFHSRYISTLVKNETGESFSSYVTSLRIRRAVELLTHTDIEVKEIAAQVGYEDQHYFSRLIRKQTRMTPSQIRKGRKS